MCEDTVTPRTNINAEDEARKALYQHFKESNWWARHTYVWKLVCAVYALVLSVLAFNMEKGAVSPGTLLGVGLTFPPLFFFLVVIKHIMHDIPWRKYKKDWSFQEYSWSTNIGDVLKIYD